MGCNKGRSSIATANGNSYRKVWSRKVNWMIHGGRLEAIK